LRDVNIFVKRIIEVFWRHGRIILPVPVYGRASKHAVLITWCICCMVDEEYTGRVFRYYEVQGNIFCSSLYRYDKMATGMLTQIPVCCNCGTTAFPPVHGTFVLFRIHFFWFYVLFMPTANHPTTINKSDWCTTTIPCLERKEVIIYFAGNMSVPNLTFAFGNIQFDTNSYQKCFNKLDHKK
jgi:hypothetical protein